MEISSERIRQYIGYVALDKANDSRDIYVSCPEMTPFLKGELKGVDIEMSVATSDGAQAYNNSINMSNCILCHYRSTDSNRLTPPDVRRGETVLVTWFSDTNTCYWDTYGTNPGVRRTERIIYGANDTLENAADLTEANAYCLIFDTRHSKKLRLSTSKTDGEEFTYFISIEPDHNRIVLSDDIDNTIMINSTNKQVILSNTAGSVLNLEKDNIVMSCRGNITIDAKGGNITMHSGQDTFFNTGNNFTHVIGGGAVVGSKGAMVYSTQASYTLSSISDMKCNTLATYSVSCADTAKVVAGNEFSVLGTNTAKIVGGSTLSLASMGTASFGGASSTSVASQGPVSIEAMGPFTATAGANASITATGSTTIGAGGGCSINAGGGLSLSFVGSGVCQCAGGSLTMRMQQLNLMKG